MDLFLLVGPLIPYALEFGREAQYANTRVSTSPPALLRPMKSPSPARYDEDQIESCVSYDSPSCTNRPDGPPTVASSARHVFPPATHQTGALGWTPPIPGTPPLPVLPVFSPTPTHGVTSLASRSASSSMGASTLILLRFFRVPHPLAIPKFPVLSLRAAPGRRTSSWPVRRLVVRRWRHWWRPCPWRP